MTIENHPHNINDKNHLMMGGRDSVEIAKEYGTPLYVYDIELVRKNARLYVDAFKKAGIKAQVTYASKAFSSIAILEVIKQENLSLDIVSEGELYTALKADFPPEKIHFHGNNKNRKELEFRSEEHTSELQSRGHLVCRLLLEKKKNKKMKC